jgi:hypothetical protein
LDKQEGAEVSAGARLVFFGNSMFLAGIRAQLQKITPLKLITVEADSPDAAALVDSCNPLAVFFDLAADHPEFAVSLLHRHQGLLLIGVDPCSDELLVLSCHPAVALNMSDLVEVINQEVLRS